MKYFLVCFSLLSYLCSYAQEENKSLNSARFGTSLAFFGAGDLYGVAIYAEYVHNFNNRLSLSPRITSGFASREGFDQITSFATSVAFGVKPFNKKSFKVDIGGLYHKIINSYGTLGDGQYWQSPIEQGYHSNENVFGFLGSLSGNIYTNKKLELGVRFDLFTGFYEGYLEADSWQVGFYIGFKH